MTPIIRDASAGDVPDILRLIHDLATYEREPGAVRTTPEDLLIALFPTDGRPVASCLVAESDKGTIIGIALWFTTFSTWTGRTGIWLEDLYVDPEHRGHGAGTALLAHLAALCTSRGWTRLEWTVLTWNTPSIAFCRALGATPQEEWRTHRLDGDALRRLAAATTTEPTEH